VASAPNRGCSSVTGANRFLRRLIVVSVVALAIVGLGCAWRVSPAASLVADGGGRPPVGAAQAGPPLSGRRQGFDRRSGDGGLALSSIDDVMQTAVIEVCVLAAVVVIDRARRRRRPVRPHGI